MEGDEVVDKQVYCPDCADCDELVVMEKHEWPVGGYVKMVCPVCGGWKLDKKDEKKDAL